MPSRLLLYCLGVPRLESEAGDEVRLGARKHLALLIYLALQPKVLHRRERLIDLFWPTVPPKAGRQSLATGLNVLRSRLGRESIDADREHIRLVRGSVHLDVDRLVAGEILGNDLTPALDIDGFLVGFYPADTPEFGMWCDRQRARLLPAIKAGLVTLMDYARRTAAVDHLGFLADRLLTIDDLAEEGIRARMEVSALAGDRLTALRIYDEWSARLASDLGATPSVFVEGMAARLRRSSWAQPRVPIRVAETGRLRHQQFVGRAEEFQRLYEQWEAVRSGCSRHILLTGESGVGKTTLADRFATGVGLEGATVARVRCFELERGIPYAAVGGLLRGVLDKPGASATSPQSLAELGRVIPAVHTYWPNLPAPVDAQGESARIRFAESALELLTVLMDEHPVVLIIDDFHIADEASLSVVHLLIRRLRDRPLMVIMTSRSNLPEWALGAAKIRDGASYLGVTVMEVSPMKVEEGEELLDRFLAGAERHPSHTERRALLDAAGGLPMALSVLTADWEQRGAASLALSLGGMTLEVTGSPDHGFRRLTESLDQGLSTTARTVLHMAAILDSRLNEFELYSLIGLSVGQTLAGMTELVTRGAMRDPGGRLEFTSPMIRASAYVRVPVVLRRGIHTLVADRLLARESEGETIPGLELAWHCIRSGRSAEAGPYLLRGGREAINSGAPHEAELALRAGIKLLSGEQTDYGRVLLAESLQEFSQWLASLEPLQLVSPANSGLRAEADIFEIMAHRQLGRIDRQNSEEYLGKLRRILSAPEGTSIRGLTALAAATVSGFLGSESRELKSLLQPLGKVSTSPEEEARLAIARAMFAYQEGNVESSLDLLRVAVEGMEENGIASSLLASLHVGRGVNHCSRGRYEDAVPEFTRAVEVATRVGSDLIVKTALANLSLAELRRGEYRASIGWASKTKPLVGTTADVTMQIGYCVAFANAMLNRFTAARLAMGTTAQDMHEDLPWLRQRWGLYQADIEWLCGHRRRAMETAKDALRASAWKLLNHRHAGPFYRWLALLAVGDGMSRKCLRLAEAALDGTTIDTFDRAEQLASCVLLRKESGLATARVRSQLEEVMAQLPKEIAVQFGRLGFDL